MASRVSRCTGIESLDKGVHRQHVEILRLLALQREARVAHRHLVRARQSVRKVNWLRATRQTTSGLIS